MVKYLKKSYSMLFVGISVFVFLHRRIKNCHIINVIIAFNYINFRLNQIVCDEFKNNKQTNSNRFILV